MTPIGHVATIGALLDSLGVPWVLGGSLASSLVGEPRSTVDIDVAIEIDAATGAALVAATQEAYYVDLDMALTAIADHTSFNLIHYGDGMKIDLFPLGDDPLDRRQLARRTRLEVDDADVWVGAPDDQVLRKLRWFRQGGEVSERQWRDVTAILATQGPAIDHAELIRVADEFDIGDLARRAVAEVS